MRNPYLKLDPAREDFDNPLAPEIDKYEKCNFCSGKLVFNHDLNLHHLVVVETGRCPKCGVTGNPKRFTLQ